MAALVIDDSRATRLILRLTLEQLGFEVSEAADGEQGLEQLRKLGRPELVVVDANMPRVDGFAFLRAVRAGAAYPGLPLVMITGEDDPLPAARALEAGADAVLRKPFTREAVRERLEGLGVIRR